MGKGAAKGATCRGCKKLAERFKDCAGCGEEFCTARCIHGRASKCEPCRHERDKAPVKRVPGRVDLVIKKPGRAPKAATAPAADEPKKCEGCGKQAKGFKACVSCGADYCAERCLMNGSKDCPSCAARPA